MVDGRWSWIVDRSSLVLFDDRMSPATIDPRPTTHRPTTNDQRPTTIDQRPTMFEAFQEPDYRRFWVSQFFSNIGSWMQTVAQGYLVYRLTDSPFLLGFVGFANAIPAFFLMLFGGVLADHLDRRRVVQI